MNNKQIGFCALITFTFVTAFAEGVVTEPKTDPLKGVHRYSAASLRNNEIVVEAPGAYKSAQLQTLSSDKTMIMMAMFMPTETPSSWSEELKITTFIGSGSDFFEASDIDGFLSLLSNRVRSYCKDNFFVEFEKSPKFDRSYVQGCQKLDMAGGQSIYEYSEVALRNKELIIVSRVIKKSSPLESALKLDDPRINAIRGEVESISLCDKNVLCPPQTSSRRAD